MKKVAWTALIFTSFFLISCTEEDGDGPAPKPKKISGEEKVRPNVIYGNDDRHDLYEIADPKIYQWAASTVALVDKRKVEIQGKTANLNTQIFGNEMNLCQDEPYFTQVMAPHCSGFLVGSDIIVTAGHCLPRQEECDKTQIVFGFAIYKAGQMPTSVDASEVYSCKEIIKTQVEFDGADYAVARLDRPVKNHQPLTLRTSGSPNPADILVVIGHPSALPTKITTNGTIRSIGTKFLVANLDTYGGNSGSAVFNSKTGEVEGILVRGETDFAWDSSGNCFRSKRCAEDQCRGEDVTLTEQVLPYVGIPSSMNKKNRTNIVKKNKSIKKISNKTAALN